MLEWQYGKADSIETVHHVLNNELGAGVLPFQALRRGCSLVPFGRESRKRVGGLKRIALPSGTTESSPKTFAVSDLLHARTALVEHARRTHLRIGKSSCGFTNWLPANRQLPSPHLA
jgi:hypothetical protein